MANIRQSRPYYGSDFQLKGLEIYQVVPSSLGGDSEHANAAQDAGEG